ncbi:hypothetical protein Tco_0697115 [Tanacetum coccineum]
MWEIKPTDYPRGKSVDKGPYPRDFPRILPWEKPVCVVVVMDESENKGLREGPATRINHYDLRARIKSSRGAVSRMQQNKATRLSTNPSSVFKDAASTGVVEGDHISVSSLVGRSAKMSHEFTTSFDELPKGVTMNHNSALGTVVTGESEVFKNPNHDFEGVNVTGTTTNPSKDACAYGSEITVDGSIFNADDSISTPYESTTFTVREVTGFTYTAMVRLVEL